MVQPGISVKTYLGSRVKGKVSVTWTRVVLEEIATIDGFKCIFTVDLK
jgi:hypothetical protein